MKNLIVIVIVAIIALIGFGLYNVVLELNNLELLQYCTAEYTLKIAYCKSDALDFAKEKAQMALALYSFIVTVISALILFKIK